MKKNFEGMNEITIAPTKPRIDQEISFEMVLERLKVYDVNGLLGRVHRSPITGKVYVKEVESWRDFHLIDLWTRPKIVGLPQNHCRDVSLYRPQPLNMRTWVYHCKFRKAKESNQMATPAEVHLFEALSARVCDIEVADGLWSPAMIYAPLFPFSLLSGDFTVFYFAGFIFFASLLISLFCNSSRHVAHERAILFPARLIFLVVTLTKIQGEALQLLGYVVIILACLFDHIRGDLQVFASMRYRCSYEIIKSLPNQVFVCWRIGDHSQFVGRKHTLLDEHVTGLKDPGDNSLCLIANVQGLLVELLPVSKEDEEIFKDEHGFRSSDAASGNLLYYGVDMFHDTRKTLADFVGHHELNLEDV